MALIIQYTRNENGSFDKAQHYDNPMEFVCKHIPDGVPFEIYYEQIGANSRVTEDFEALKKPGTFHIIEGAGGGAVGAVVGFVGSILNPILKILLPSQKASTPNTIANQQAESPNNSLTDRNNKPRPYQRTYDICGTVQSIPSDLMTTYKKYDRAGNIIEFGYYDVGRGPLYTPVSGITDGDTLLSSISGSSAAVYRPFTSPNSGDAPQVQIGDAITEGLYITVSSNEVDGEELKASNDVATFIGAIARAFYNSSNGLGVLSDATGDSDFTKYMKSGDLVSVFNVYATGPGGEANLSGVYTAVDVSGVSVTLDVSGNTTEWAKLGSSSSFMVQDRERASVGPAAPDNAILTDWITVRAVKCTRAVANFGAANGMYKDDGQLKIRAAVRMELQYQALDDNLNPVGPVYSSTGVVSGRSAAQTGVTVTGFLPTPSYFRARARRLTIKDTAFQGQVVDNVTFDNLYGQAVDTSKHYGDRTTIHTARRQTPRATSIKSPRLGLIVTEQIYKYLGNGVFDTKLTNNTQAVQSLIRLLRDPVVGNLNLSADNMDKLLSVQAEVENYFGTPLAGQFCYTFDSFQTTTQEITTAIAEAIFCSVSRRGKSILLDLERPRLGPEMVFTHRSKAPSGEKWTRQFNDKTAYDSLKYTYIDPTTNIKETITIPPEGGVKTDTYDSKGVRNYRQAYWHAYRRYQRNRLNRVSVEFTALEEGVLAVPARPVSVVKGSRVSPYDGYVVAVDGLTLVLSQNVEFKPGENHSLILKKRDGGVQSVGVIRGHNDRTVIMLSAPQEAIYTGNDALKTEFSFGSDSRHAAQMILVSTVEPSDDRTVRITGFNYTDDYYKYDGVSPYGRGFSDGFSNGFL